MCPNILNIPHPGAATLEAPSPSQPSRSYLMPSPALLSSLPPSLSLPQFLSSPLLALLCSVMLGPTSPSVSSLPLAIFAPLPCAAPPLFCLTTFIPPSWPPNILRLQLSLSLYASSLYVSSLYASLRTYIGLSACLSACGCVMEQGHRRQGGGIEPLPNTHTGVDFSM